MTSDPSPDTPADRASEAVVEAFEALGRNLRTQRRARKVSLEDLQRSSGLSRKYLTRLERGEEEPTLRHICQLAYGLGCEPQELVAGVPALTPKVPDPPTAVAGFERCSDCWLPRTGQGFRKLLFHLAEDQHLLSRSAVAKVCKIKVPSMMQYVYKDKLPGAFRDRLGLLIEGGGEPQGRAPEAVSDSSQHRLPNPADFAVDCPDCKREIRSGSGLRRLLEHLLSDHGVEARQVADACQIQLSTLDQYRYRPDGGLPSVFRTSIWAFVNPEWLARSAGDQEEAARAAREHNAHLPRY